jgi:hypothetical protein
MSNGVASADRNSRSEGNSLRLVPSHLSHHNRPALAFRISSSVTPCLAAASQPSAILRPTSVVPTPYHPSSRRAAPSWPRPLQPACAPSTVVSQSRSPITRKLRNINSQSFKFDPVRHPQPLRSIFRNLPLWSSSTLQTFPPLPAHLPLVILLPHCSRARALPISGSSRAA